ncbi:hypothetical protein J3B02_001866 [Coemansia erecta]|uniref:Thioesterase domain-containing protein n=1 Tax=Coemansia asiatica TaxID=1052880 RepID=A0A9W7XJY1_9FUNG|nr:hypothetical protein LPJ64_003544 [Coemansia asiatica]KAJ2855985.1 hypothetical protein J3B02_001866 [Coemansia erecta]
MKRVQRVAFATTRRLAGTSYRLSSTQASAAVAKPHVSDSATITMQPETDSGTLDIRRVPCPKIDWPLEYTQQQIDQTLPLLERAANIPLVKRMLEQNGAVRKEFHWPAGKQRLVQAPETFTYGAMLRPQNLPLVPLVFAWRPRFTPDHLNREMFDASFQDPNLPKQSVQIRIPGVTIVNYLGPELGFNGLVDGIAGRLRTVHPGLPTALIDDITARACFSNMSGKPAFTANFQLEYLTPIPVERFIVMDAWVTCIERRKTFISTHLADAMTGQTFVKAKTLFVSAT